MMDIEAIVKKLTSAVVEWDNQWSMTGDGPDIEDVIRNALTELAAGYEQKITRLKCAHSDSVEEVREHFEGRIRQLEAERVPEWRQQKPTEPGAYWLKGNIFNVPDAVSLVRVEWFDGELSIVAGDDPEDHRASLTAMRDDFYWAGPLAATPQQKQLCPKCGGSGEHALANTGVTEDDNCRACAGSGYAPQQKKEGE